MPICAGMRRYLVRVSSALVAALLLALIPASGKAQNELGGDRVLLEAIEDYFNSFKTLRARFTQYNPDGSQVEGMLWLKRPGRFRFEYAPPNDQLLVGDGRWLIFYDAELDQLSHLPLDRGAPRFLTRKEIRFDEEVRVVSVERRDGMIRVIVVDAEDPETGSLSMLFEEDPMALRQWTVVDAQNAMITVVLRDLEYGVDLDNDFFYFTQADRGKDFREGTYD